MLTESLREAKALLGQVIAEITHAAQEAKETEAELVSEHRRSMSKEAALALQLQLAREQDEEKLQTLESKREELDLKSREVENLVAEKLKQQQDLRSACQPTSLHIYTLMHVHTRTHAHSFSYNPSLTLKS
jgi:cyanate lyase